MDVDRMLQELNLEHEIAAGRLRDIDEAIATLVKLKAAREGRVVASATSGKRGRKSNADWPRARQMYERGGVTIGNIAASIGVSETAVWAHKKSEGWNRPEGGK